MCGSCHVERNSKIYLDKDSYQIKAYNVKVSFNMTNSCTISGTLRKIAWHLSFHISQKTLFTPVELFFYTKQITPCNLNCDHIKYKMSDRTRSLFIVETHLSLYISRMPFIILLQRLLLFITNQDFCTILNPCGCYLKCLSRLPTPRCNNAAQFACTVIIASNNNIYRTQY